MRRAEYEAMKKSLQAKLAALESEPIEEDYNRWTPETGETYYQLGDEGDVFENRWNDNLTDQYLYNLGNCFRTKEAAAFAAETLKVIAELRNFADPANVWDGKTRHYYLAYNYDRDAILILGEQGVRTHDIYFSSIKVANKAITEIGEGRIKKYYLGIL